MSSRLVLFRSADLLVVQVAGFASDTCVVTFDSFTDVLTLDRNGFAEDFLRSHQINAIHVISRTNEWYQYAETAAALACVRNATAAYRRVVTYGISMGGYAAIRLAGLAGAQCALALAPQFSILRDTAAFEYRWATAAGQINPVWENTLPLPALADAYVVFDPLSIDSIHADLYAATGFRFTAIQLRGAGHQTAGFLLEVGLLQDFVLAVCLGPIDAPALEQEAWRRRRLSPQHRLALAHRVRSPAWRLALVHRAVELAPGQARLLGQLGVAFRQAGRLDEAVAAHLEALALLPGHPALLAEYSITLAARGEDRDALAALEQACKTVGEAAHAPLLGVLRARLAGPSSDGNRRITSCDPGAIPLHGTPASMTEAGQCGIVLFGPFVEVQPGRYEVEFTVTARPGPPPGLVRRMAAGLLDRRITCVLDVAIHSGRTRLARRRLSVAAVRASPDGRFRLTFTMPEWTTCEFRVFAWGRIGLIIQPTRPCRLIERVGRTPPGLRPAILARQPDRQPP